MGCKECGKPKCNGECGCKSPKVLQINNPAEYITFHKVSIPAAMGDSTTNPPKIGAYRNALVYYEADHTSWMYSTDGIPTLVTGEHGDQGPQGEPGPQGYMNEQDVRDVVDTIVPEGFFDDESIVSDCGTEFELSNVIDGEAKTLALIGNTYQQSYIGKNLIDGGLNAIVRFQRCHGSSDGNGFTLTRTSAGAAYAVIPFPNVDNLLGKTLTISFNKTGVTATTAKIFTLTSGGYASTRVQELGVDGGTFTMPSSIPSGTVGFCLCLYIDSSSQTATYWNVQAEEGSTATSFEPFTGGQPSPSPVSPQPIQSVTSEQAIKIYGKNLLKLGDTVHSGLDIDIDQATGEITWSGTSSSVWPWISDSGETINLPAGTYTFSIQNVLPYSIAIRTYRADGTYPTGIGQVISAGSTAATFTVDFSIKRITLLVNTGVGEVTQQSVKAMLEHGGNATDFVPYIERSAVVDLGSSKLNNIGGQKDRIWDDNGIWKIHHETDAVIINSLFDGSSYSINSKSPNTTRVLINDCLGRQGVYEPSNVRGSAKCNRFECASIWNTDTVGFFIDTNASLTKNGLCFRAPKDIIGTGQNSVEAWINANPLEIVYPIASPVDEIITDEQLIAQLDSIQLLSGVNRIYITSSGLTADICIDAYVDNFAGNIENLSDRIEKNKKYINYDNYYSEVTYTKERFYDTDCYFVTIPKTDNNGDEIELYIGDAGANGSPITYARENHTTFTSNATLNHGGSIGVGSLIANGEIIRDVDTSSWQYDANLYLGIKANRELVEYPFKGTTADQMLNDGCIQAWDVYYKILENGEVLDMSNVSVADSGVPTNKHPRQCLGQKADGTIIMLSCDARTPINAGLTSEESAQLLLDKGCVNAWNLDGGGSTSTMIKEAKLNRNIDGDGTSDRKIRYTLNTKKPTLNLGVAGAYSKISEEKQNIIQQIIPFIGATSLSTDSTDIRGQDLNKLTDKLIFGYGNNLSNVPTGVSRAGYFVNIPHSWDEWKGKYCTQFYIQRDDKVIWVRQLVNETFNTWERVNGLNKFQATSGTNLTIAANNTYEAVPLRYTFTNNGSMFTKADYDSTTDTFTKFKIGRGGSCTLHGRISFTAATSGQKFISFFKGDTRIGSSIAEFNAEAGKEVVVSTFAFVESFAATDEFSLRAYGSQGDVCAGNKIMAEID